MELTDIIIAPVITEKAQKLSENLNQYAFIVNKKANKIQIKEAVEKLYNVKVLSVNTMNFLGKQRRKYTKSGIIQGRTNNYKKAIVTLADTDTIDFFSNV